MRPRGNAAVLAIPLAGALAAACVPGSRYPEPRQAFTATAAPGIDATAAALVGEWTGHYDAPVYARRGELRVSLRRVARAVDGGVTSTVAGTAIVAGTRVTVDSAHVARGRVVLWFQPMADRESGATIQLRLDGALAADTLGGRLRADAAATVAPEHHGGWRVIRVASVAPRAARGTP